ncbi:Uncharacterized protein FWK35_00034992, partial [Aphis craccivora]
MVRENIPKYKIVNGLCITMKILFGTDNELQLLIDADTWFLDGNFKLAPKQYIQLYIIRIEKNSVYAGAYLALPSRGGRNLNSNH